MADSSWMDDLFNAAALYFMKQQNSKTPNFYSQPLTPNEQWKTDTTKDLYGRVNDYVTGMIGNTNLTPSGFKFMSPMFQGQPFAGGVGFAPQKQLPLGSQAKPNSTYPGRDILANNMTGGGGGGNFNQRINHAQYFGTGALGEGPGGGDVSIYDGITSGGWMPSDYGNLFPEGPKTPTEASQIANGTKPQGDAASVASWLKQQLTSRPELAKLGRTGLIALITATLGPGAGLGAKAIAWIVDRVLGNASPTAPPATSQPAPGTVPGAPPLP